MKQECTGWPRHRENRENRELTLTFSRQGNTREFCCDTGKIFETQGKYFDCICYVNVIFLCTFGSPGFKRWGFVGDSLSPIAHKMCVDGFCLEPG